MERRLSAILAADMVGYSRLMAEDEIGTIERQTLLKKELMDPAFEKHNGRVFKEMGDGLMVEFPSVVEAVECAVEIQRALFKRERDAPVEERMNYRIGINLGDIVVEGNDIYGDGVNVASRLEGKAKPGGICVSGAAYDQIRSTAGFGFRSLGELHIKNIDRPIRAYQVVIDEAKTTRPKLRSRNFFSAKLLASLLLIGLLALGALYWSQAIFPAHNGGEELGSGDQASIAVFPFENLSADPDQSYFADGIAEDIITDLSKIEGLFIIASNTSFQFRDSERKLVDIGRELGVRYVLEGSVRRSGNRARINAQLLEVETGGQLWAERYDGQTSDLFGFQDRVTGQIIDALQPTLTSEERQSVVAHETENPDAYDAYLRGLRLIANRQRLDVDSNAAAQRAFKEAIELDEEYSSAYAGLGWTKWLRFEQIDTFDQKSRNEAFELARKSIELSDNALARRVLARRHLSILNYWAETTRDVGAAVLELEQGLELEPNNPDVLVDLALALNFVGEPEKALELAKKAKELNPSHPGWYFAASGIAYLLSGESKRAVVDLQKWVDSDPVYNVPHLFLASAYGLSGDTEAANFMLHRYERLSNTIDFGTEITPGPHEIRTTSYAVKRRWPMAKEHEQVFLQGLYAGGMRDLEN